MRHLDEKDDDDTRGQAPRSRHTVTAPWSPPTSRSRLPAGILARAGAIACAAALAVCAPRVAHAVEPQPWVDADPDGAPKRTAIGDYGFRGGLEYRSNYLMVNPITLGGTSNRRASWFEHRLRLDATLDYLDKVKFITSIDVLDGVVFGDNGTLGGSPSSNAGINLNARNPNAAVPCVQLQPNGDIADPNAYGYGLCPQDQLTIRRAYGDVALPFGILRIGRQPIIYGTGVFGSDGDGRANRWGFARRGNQVDRILFATKPLEAFKRPEDVDKSENNGLVFAIGYDKIVSDQVYLRGDDVQQIFTALKFGKPTFADRGKDLALQAFYVRRWDGQYSSSINAMGLRAQARYGPIYAGFDTAFITGHTREISSAYSLLTSDPVVDQDIRQYGGRAVVRFEQPYFAAHLEAAYASGDSDPQVRTPLTQFVFAEDANIGLLLFKHVLGFQSARASAAGTEVLRRLGATTFPSEAVATRGSFTNAKALFPQVDVTPHKNVMFRFGALFAWCAEPMVDPVSSLQRRDGNSIKDDLVNFAGGKPGNYYGTELDARIRLKFIDHFNFDLESAVLFPGDALQNQDGVAVRSMLVQGRTTYYF